jgi:hypothetical protein
MLTSTGDDASHHAGMVARKPITRESAKEAVKTIVQEKPDRIWRTCGDLLVSFVFRHEAAGALEHPAFPAPSVLGGT